MSTSAGGEGGDELGASLRSSVVWKEGGDEEADAPKEWVLAGREGSLLTTTSSKSDGMSSTASRFSSPLPRALFEAGSSDWETSARGCLVVAPLVPGVSSFACCFRKKGLVYDTCKKGVEETRKAYVRCWCLGCAAWPVVSDSLLKSG